MPTQSISKRTLPWRFYSIVAVAGGLILAIFIYSQTGTEQTAPASSPAHAANDVFGPGVLTGSDGGTSLAKQEEEHYPLAPGGLTADASQHLVINDALLQVINFYLLEQAPSNRADVLQRYLAKSLPPPAYAEAAQILAHYQSYMKAHDDLLAGQNLGGQDFGSRSRNIERLLTWREQRDRLRLNMLGDKVAQAWYQNDDLRFKEVLDELHEAASAAPPQEDQRGAASHSLSNDEQREQGMQEILDKETKSFNTLAIEGQQWTRNFAAFLAASNRINQQSGVSTFERDSQIQALLVKTFPTEAERQRARDLAP
ncbi:MAG TPA: hypothetical protein VK832_22290 [Burkholderiaceae bacterium]|nr:hypothetical protein [Burkholderiaceae bacterium]